MHCKQFPLGAPYMKRSDGPGGPGPVIVEGKSVFAQGCSSCLVAVAEP